MQRNVLFSPRFFPGFWDSIPKRCKGVHCVDLGESFPTHIYLQKLASIQPRTSLVKFARSPRTDPPGLHMPQFVQSRGGTEVEPEVENFRSKALRLCFENDTTAQISARSFIDLAHWLRTWAICNSNNNNVHGERANFTRLVLGCIEANFANEIIM